jgi:hypothetical protein
MTTELLKGSGGLAADALLRVNAGDGGRSAPTTPQVAALEASETPVEGGGPGQPLFLTRPSGWCRLGIGRARLPIPPQRP